MNQSIQTIYKGMFIVSILIYLYNWNVLTDKKYIVFDCKYLLIIAIGISMTYSLYIKNKSNDEYIFPSLLFINIGILIAFSVKYKNSNIFHLMSLFGIILLLLSFHRNKFQIEHGILTNPDTHWIYSSIAILLLYYITMRKHSTKRATIAICLLVVYPLLFPIQEYFIHRIYTLLFIVALNVQFFRTLH